MTELNEAFDALMGAIRTGTPVNSRRTANAGEPEPDTGAAANGRYRAIRQMINSGAVEQALAELNAIQAVPTTRNGTSLWAAHIIIRDG